MHHMFYVLIQSSGLEALYWAQKYPDEVSAIIGLDMAVPSYYENMQINYRLCVFQVCGKIGVTRLIPGISESDDDYKWYVNRY